jgi:hypothetical protein
MNNTYIQGLVLILLLLGCSRSEQQTPGKDQSSSRSLATTPNGAKGKIRPQKPATPLDGTDTNRLVPPVELDTADTANRRFQIIMHAGDWSGCNLRRIIPPHDIKRIIRVYDDGFTTDQGLGAQRQYDDLMSHLIESNEKATDYGLLAEEREIASLIVLTKDGKAYCIEVLQSWGTGVSAINVSGAGKGARIKVTGRPIAMPPPVGSPRRQPVGHIPVSGREY